MFQSCVCVMKYGIEYGAKAGNTLFFYFVSETLEVKKTTTTKMTSLD